MKKYKSWKNKLPELKESFFPTLHTWREEMNANALARVLGNTVDVNPQQKSQFDRRIVNPLQRKFPEMSNQTLWKEIVSTILALLSNSGSSFSLKSALDDISKQNGIPSLEIRKILLDSGNQVRVDPAVKNTIRANLSSMIENMSGSTYEKFVSLMGMALLNLSGTASSRMGTRSASRVFEQNNDPNNGQAMMGVNNQQPQAPQQQQPQQNQGQQQPQQNQNQQQPQDHDAAANEVKQRFKGWLQKAFDQLQMGKMPIQAKMQFVQEVMKEMQ